MQARSACLGQTLFTSANMSVEKPVQLNNDIQAFRESVSRFINERAGQPEHTYEAPEQSYGLLNVSSSVGKGIHRLRR